MIKILGSLAIASGLVLVLLGVGIFWLDRLFEETGATLVPSLVRQLDARSVLAILAHPDDEILMVGRWSKQRRDRGLKRGR